MTWWYIFVFCQKMGNVSKSCILLRKYNNIVLYTNVQSGSIHHSVNIKLKGRFPWYFVKVCLCWTTSKLFLSKRWLEVLFSIYGENSQSKQVTKQESQSCWFLKPCKNRRLEVYMGGGWDSKKIEWWVEVIMCSTPRPVHSGVRPRRAGDPRTLGWWHLVPVGRNIICFIL